MIESVNSRHGNGSGLQPGSEEVVNADGILAPAYRFDYAGRCWWCGRVADSGEHKFKRADLVRAFGNGPWKGQAAVTQVVDGLGQWDLQSSRSQRLKFSKVFCGDCNSNKSQEFDFAYDKFADYATSEQTRILADEGFRWSDIFGSQWKDGRSLVTAYWLKHIGCRFADGGIEVDPRIVAFLDRPGHIRSVPLRMELQLREDWLEVAEHMRLHGERDLKSFSMSPLMCLYSRSRQLIHQVTGDCVLGWIGLVYQFDLSYSRSVTNFWTDKVRLSRYSSVPLGSVAQNCTLCGRTVEA
jgi:hypothetical protein